MQGQSTIVIISNISYTKNKNQETNLPSGKTVIQMKVDMKGGIPRALFNFRRDDFFNGSEQRQLGEQQSIPSNKSMVL